MYRNLIIFLAATFACAQAFADVTSGRYTIINLHSGLTLDVDTSVAAEGANVLQWTPTGAENQQFDVADLGDGRYSIRPAHTGMSLDVWEWSAEPGGEIRQWTYSGADNQKWQINDLGNGQYSIISDYNGLSLDVWEWSTESGGDIRQWTYSGAANQQWSFVPVSGNGGGGGTVVTAPFDTLFDESVGDGRCSVERVYTSASTFYVPTDPSNSSARFNILGWGNGTGGTSTTYSTLLESLASQCVIVAAANTENSGTGEDVQNAVNGARSRYASKVLPSHKVCTSGHSQGGGGSFNAANRLGADCVIGIQADTLYTTEIYGPVANHVEVIALWSEDDSLAPAGSEYFTSNTVNVEANTSILAEVETANEDHFTITRGRGGDIGTMFRMAVKAQLSNDYSEAGRFRHGFWGSETESTVTTSAREISEVERDSGAISTNP